MKRILHIACLALLIMTAQVQAQTRCPQGAQAGSMQCLPDDPQSTGNARPRPTGEWIKTWGAIAGSNQTGETGAVVGKFSEDEAKKAALRLCAEGNAKDCQINLVYFNQCAALVSSKSRSFFQGAESKEIAIDLAKKDCDAHGSGQCEIIYSGCTDPVFRRY